MFPLDLSYLRPKLGDDQRLYWRHLGYESKVKALQTANQILYHPMHEASGGVADDHSPQGNDGAYTGVTLGETGIGDGRTCPLFDGVNDYNDFYSAGFNADFDGQEGTLAGWAKASDWTAPQNLVNVEVSNNNEINFINSPSNNLGFRYGAGGTVKDVGLDVTGLTDWIHLAMTWSLSADKMIAYYNGAQEGATQTGLGTWAGGLHADRNCFGASSNVPGQPFAGYLAHWVIYDTPLIAADILSLATL